jgi:hypothetical protein
MEHDRSPKRVGSSDRKTLRERLGKSLEPCLRSLISSNLQRARLPGLIIIAAMVGGRLLLAEIAPRKLLFQHCAGRIFASFTKVKSYRPFA